MKKGKRKKEKRKKKTASCAMAQLPAVGTFLYRVYRVTFLF